MEASEHRFINVQRLNNSYVRAYGKGSIMMLLGDTMKNGPLAYFGHNLLPELRVVVGDERFNKRTLITNPPLPRAYGRNRYFLRENLVFLVIPLILSLFSSPAVAVSVNFTNCLPESYQNNIPLALQFVPKHVDVVFNNTDPSHNLKVTIWGNVVGSQSTEPLPAANDSAWSNPNITLGKIENLTAPYTKLTTLSNKITVLTYEPWNENVDFCDRLVNGSCPLGQRFGVNE